MRDAYDNEASTRVSSGRSKPSSASQSGRRDRRPVASTTRSARSAVVAAGAVRPTQSDAGNTITVESGEQAIHRGAVEHLDARGRQHSATGAPLDQRSGRRDEPVVWSEAIDPPGRAEPEEVGGDRHVHGAGSHQFVGQPGQQPLHRLLAAREDDVQVIALGDSRAVRRMVREAVALDDRDSPEVT